MYLKDKPGAITNLPKFEPRGEFGLVVGYGVRGSFIILQLAPLIQDNKRLFKRTRDVKFPAQGPVFPVRALLKAREPEVSWHYLLPCEQAPEASEPQEPDQRRCATCSGIITDVEVTCPACLQGPAKRLK